MRATGKLTRWLVTCLALAASPAAAQSIWAETPSAEEIGAFTPSATDHPTSVAVRMMCDVAADGRLSECRILSETPRGTEFGAFALTIAPKFRATPEAARKLKGSVVIPIRFGPPEDAAPPRRDARFQRSGAYARLGDAGPYYPDRAARTGQMSVVEADCRVVDNGLLRDCRVIYVSNPDYGFEFAFLKMAERGWMTAAPLPGDIAAPPDGIWRFRMVFDAKRR